MRKPVGSSGRVSHLIVDGASVEGNLVPLAPAGATLDVDAVVAG